MKKKDLKNLREKSGKELNAEAGKMRLEVQVTYAKIKAGQEKNIKKVKKLKKDIAQILTIAREKEIIEKEMKQ